MSFLGGPECSTGGNPLSQFSKHTQEDKSLQRDRLAGQGSAGLQESFRSQQNGMDQDQVGSFSSPSLPVMMYERELMLTRATDDAKFPSPKFAAPTGTSTAIRDGADAPRFGRLSHELAAS